MSSLQAIFYGDVFSCGFLSHGMAQVVATRATLVQRSQMGLPFYETRLGVEAESFVHLEKFPLAFAESLPQKN